MVSINACNLTLVYRLYKKFGLAPPDRRVPEASNIRGRRGRKEIVALNDVSFTLNAGDRLGLIGANGGGKTTLLKVLAGIFEPTEGTLDARGRRDSLFNINIGFRREATGRRNIVLRGLINGWSAGEIDRRIDEIIAFSELGDFIDVPFKAYSQGMAARLAFAVATSMEPEILLMDEWIGAGDASFQLKAKERMDSLAEKAGIIVLASHNRQLLEKTCNKVLELKSGRMTFFGDADEYFAKTA